jgi:hypothetical protein
LAEETIYDFPEINSADENGLLAIGGNLSFGTLINATKKEFFRGIIPAKLFNGILLIRVLFFSQIK